MSSLEEVSALIITKSWTERISLLYKSEVMSDCVFIIGDGEDQMKIPSHKFILSAISQDFYSAFNLMEASSNEIFICNFSIDIFDLFLEFVYRNKISLSMTIIWQVLKMAHFYNFQNLMDECIDFIGTNITAENIYTVLQEAIAFDLEKLDKKCFDFIKKNTYNFLIHPKFLEVHLEHIEKILQFDTLTNVKEIEIYRYVNKWAENKCRLNNDEPSAKSKRRILGAVLKQIRFGSMTGPEFNECVTDQNSILLQDEISDIFKSIALGDATINCEFSNVTRVDFIVPTMCLVFSDNPDNPDYKIGNYGSMFTVNENILCCGLVLVRNSKMHQRINDLFYIKYSIRDLSYFKNNQIAENSVYIASDDNNKLTYKVFFKNEIFLTKNTWYEVFAHCENYYWSRIKDIVVEKDGVEFKFNDNLFDYWKCAGVLFYAIKS